MEQDHKEFKHCPHRRRDIVDVLDSSSLDSAFIAVVEGMPPSTGTDRVCFLLLVVVSLLFASRESPWRDT